MLQPKRQKYRKQFRTGAWASSSRGTTLSFGEFGLKAMERGRLSERQIEAARRAIAYFTRKGGKIWIRVFPDKPVTKKAAGTRMGSGKGDICGYEVPITAGKIIFEVSGITQEAAVKAMWQASHRLAFKTSFVAKE